MTKKFTIILFVLICHLSLPHLNAQASFSDDFEAYAANAFLCVSNNKWKTWDNKPGTATDVKVSDEKAKSGTKSLKFVAGSASGGPTDIVLPFGARYATGRFILSMDLLVPQDKNAYFNIQGTTTVGQTWSLNGFFEASGALRLTGSNNAGLFSATYPVEQWFNFKLDINLSANSWKVLIDDQCQGTFSNNTNAVASLNLYPVNGSSVWFVDNVSYQYTSTAPSLANDVSVSNLNWKSGRLTDTEDVISFNLKNGGSQAVNTVDLLVKNNNQEEMISLSNLGLSWGQSKAITTSKTFKLDEGQNEITVEVLKLNGTAGDQEACNNRSQLLLSAVTPAPDKAILVEEGTGTWCQWCPRGAVFMDLLSKRYPNRFIPIAVHNNDPMMVQAYDALVRSTPGFAGFPSSVIDRSIIVDPSQMENPFIDRIATETVAKIKPGARYKAADNSLDISAEIEFKKNATGEFWVNMVLTEDGVRGTGTGYNQSNAYANNAAGPMGGYETLPNPVPAAQMVYEHVARAISGIQKTAANTLNGTFTEGTKRVVNFNIPLPQGVNKDSLHIIPILLSSNGYENASIATLKEAEDNGFSVNVENIIYTESVQVYPNPATEIFYIDLAIKVPSQINIAIRDISGRLMFERNYGRLEGDQVFPVNTVSLQSGVYFAEITTDEGAMTKKIVVNK